MKFSAYPTPPEPQWYYGGIKLKDGTFLMFSSAAYTHPRYEQANGIQPHEVEARLGWSPDQQRWIDYASIGQPDRGEYHFGGLDEPLTTVHDPYKPHPSDTDRRPIIYIPDRDELHIGGWGDSHGSVYRKIDPDYEDSAESWNGYYNRPGPNRSSLPGPGTFGWYDADSDPQTNARVLKAIEQNIPDAVGAQDMTGIYDFRS